MYVIRSALRVSTGRPPARFIRGRRYPSIPRPRSLHTTRALAEAAKPPPGSGNTPIDGNDTSKPDAEKAAGEEHADAAVASEDPELIARKLQRLRASARKYSAALGRHQRVKQTPGLPPVHIPDWFLKSRVIRREDPLENAGPPQRPTSLSVTVSHAASGEQATCSIPVSDDGYLDAAQVLSRLIRGLWKRRLDDHETRKVDEYMSERIALADKTSTDDAATEEASTDARNEQYSLNDGPHEAAVSDMVRKWGDRIQISWGEMANNFEQTPSPRDLLRLMREFEDQLKRPETIAADSSCTSQQKLDAFLEKKEASLGRWLEKALARRLDHTSQISQTSRISPLVLAEVRATMAASLSALQPAVGDLFPAAKTNLIIHSPAAGQEGIVDACIHRLAEDLHSDVIVLTAQDLAQLAGDYLGEGPEPTPRSIRSLGYETYRLSAELREQEPDATEDTAEDENNPNPLSLFGLSGLLLSPGGRFPLFGRRRSETNVNANANANNNIQALTDNTGRTPSQSELQLEDMKLAALLDTLIDANEAKQDRGLVRSQDSHQSHRSLIEPTTSSQAPRFFDYSVGSEGTDLEFNSALPMEGTGDGISMSIGIGSSLPMTSNSERAKIVYVKDFKELNATHYGGRLIQKLEELVRKRRTAGESVMIIGSTCNRELTPELSARYDLPFYLRFQLTRRSGVRGLQGDDETSLFRTIVVDEESDSDQSALLDALAAPNLATGADQESTGLSPAEAIKFRSINLSHIREMLRSLDPAAAAKITDVEKSPQLFRTWATIFPLSYFSRVLTYDEVHRISLTALGLYVTSTDPQRPSSQMSWAHVALAMGLLKASDGIKYASFKQAEQLAKKPREPTEKFGGDGAAKLKAKVQLDARAARRALELQGITANATQHEKLLIPGIADADQIKTTFDQVHVPLETIDSIRTITSLALLRPDAFTYGILAKEKITGALLYGPPGTGKTLLAKAVAKESGSRVLEVSGAQIGGKYVGESEKNVAAIFSLAQKLSPCIIFLDEADYILGSRNGQVDRGAHRATLNQFLKEWDGMSNSSVFVMVATNRPFDLDDAVIRRLPRRLLVDLPTQADREAILRIHLQGEQLDDSVDLESLAKRTPFYSGSDLKNIAVSAALASVKEENQEAALAAAKATSKTESSVHSKAESATDSTASTEPTATSAESTAALTAPSPPKVLHLVRGQTYNFPEKRTLHLRHFDKALQEITASISEDMSSLSAIKKFDEQYGDRKGKRGKKDFGFGVATQRSENAARVRV
jgi:SpoVK/Ycf46/Vps4 family AAA+-type ATPase